jgi:hypothetical protein
VPEGRNLRDEARVLIKQAAVQQAESSASRMHSVASEKAGGTAQQDHEASVHIPLGGRGKAVTADGAKAPSVHDRIKKPPANERIRDTRGCADDGDARNIINGKKYNPWRGGRIDPEHDRGYRRSLPVPVCSAGRSALPHFPRAFVSPPPSSTTWERQTPRTSSMTTAWHAS